MGESPRRLPDGLGVGSLGLNRMEIEGEPNGGPFLNQDLCFLEFGILEEAIWVLESGRRWFKGGSLKVDWWCPDFGCVNNKEMIREAEEFKDYRLISLVGSLYKLVAKVLANRLKKVMHSLINEAQTAFVKGRQIMDASLLANEVINTMLKRKKRGVLSKLDIEKAYDQIN